MYSPHTDFIPFIRQVDECVKEMVNKKAFLELGDFLVKVSTFLKFHIIINFITGSPFTFRKGKHCTGGI